MSNTKPRVLILGAGFGGMYAALEFERALARGADLDVTLVNRDNFFLFTPMLHEVAASDLDITNIVSPIRKLLRRVTFFHGDIEAIDLVHKRVGLSHGHEEHCHSLPYDHLVLALGSTTNFFNIPGLADRALTMKSLDDQIFLRNRLIAGQALDHTSFLQALQRPHACEEPRSANNAEGSSAAAIPPALLRTPMS